MRGKAAKALRRIVRDKWPKLEEADKKQFSGYLRRVKRLYKSLPRPERHKMISMKGE